MKRRDAEAQRGEEEPSGDMGIWRWEQAVSYVAYLRGVSVFPWQSVMNCVHPETMKMFFASVPRRLLRLCNGPELPGANLLQYRAPGAPVAAIFRAEFG